MTPLDNDCAVPEDVEAWELPAGTLVVGDGRPPLEGLVRLREGCPGVSQLGGHPAWEQQPVEPDCPRCGRAMPFVGHAAVGELTGEPADGLFYAFACGGCATTAVVYQQT